MITVAGMQSPRALCLADQLKRLDFGASKPRGRAQESARTDFCIVEGKSSVREFFRNSGVGDNRQTIVVANSDSHNVAQTIWHRNWSTVPSDTPPSHDSSIAFEREAELIASCYRNHITQNITAK